MLNIIELNNIQNIESKYYMKPIIDAINLDISKNNLKWHEVFDRLYNYLENNKDTVKELTQKRVKEGKIKNSEQAIKSIAGGAFSNLIIWVFLKNKENNIDTKILSFDAMCYTILTDDNNNNFDLPFLGNLGKNGEEGLIQEIQQLKNTKILIKTNEEDVFWQESKKVRKYIKGRLCFEENKRKKRKIPVCHS